MSRNYSKYYRDEDESPDFCRHYSLYGRDVIDLNWSKELFDYILDSTNAILFRTMEDNISSEYSFVCLERDDEVGESRKRTRPKDDEMWTQVREIVELYNQVICRKGITKEFVDKAVKEYKYAFIATKHDEQLSPYIYERCSIKSFKFLKDHTETVEYLTNYKIIESILVCAAPIQRKSHDARNILLNPSMGSYLTYQSVEFARDKGYDFYMLRSADFDLIKLYMRWGFHFGLPFLNLDKEFLDLPGKFPELNNASKMEYFEVENLVRKEMMNVIGKMFYVDQKLLEFMFRIPKDEWVKRRDEKKDVAFMPEAFKIAKFITKYSSFAMYIDLNSKDPMTLEMYSKKRMTEYFA